MIHQSQLQKQHLKILPQQVQLLGIHHLNIMELEQRIKDELDENPLLEDSTIDESAPDKKELDDQPQDFQNWEEYEYDDIPNYAVEHQNYLPNDEVNIPIKDSPDFRAGLKQQLINLNLNEEEKNIALFLLDCISDNGYLERSIPDLADDYSFMYKSFLDENVIESILKKIQDLEPIGNGCRNIREFLLKQLSLQKQNPIVNKSIELVSDQYDELQKKNFQKICTSLNIDEDELSVVLKHIAHLQLNPLNIDVENEPQKYSIVADFILSIEDEKLSVNLYKQRAKGLHINEILVKNIEENKLQRAEDKSAAQYIKSKLSSAQWFIEAIQQREENMLLIIRAILKRQQNFFLTGDISSLESMILKNIADEVSLDISTVSRVTCNKYIDTHFGMVLLKDLFTEGIITEEGLSISNKVVQLKLKDIIESEDKDSPYNDIQLAKILGDQGIKIARRTVAKYRDQLKIPVVSMRRILAKGE
ncbi:MAG: RNA polymerase factor sigma-54 [Ferruginibacter sp.]